MAFLVFILGVRKGSFSNAGCADAGSNPQVNSGQRLRCRPYLQVALMLRLAFAGKEEVCAILPGLKIGNAAILLDLSGGVLYP